MTNALTPTVAPSIQPVGAAPMAMAPSAGGELAQTAAAARAQAEVQARYTMALVRPRNLEGVRLRILADCDRYEFAETALYRLPYGDDAEGLSIRFAEAARQAYTNMLCSRTTLHDSEALIVVRISVVDLEANATEEREVSVEKVIERSRPRRGEVPIGTRVGSNNQTVYICRPGKSEVSKLVWAEAAKAERECTLKLIRSDIKRECLARIKAAIRKGAKEDEGAKGEARRRDLLDKLHRRGVTPEDVTRYLGHPISQMNPAEYQDLCGVLAGLGEGAAWADFVEARTAAQEEAAAPTAKSTATKDVLKARQGQAQSK